MTAALMITSLNKQFCLVPVIIMFNGYCHMKKDGSFVNIFVGLRKYIEFLWKGKLSQKLKISMNCDNRIGWRLTYYIFQFISRKQHVFVRLSLQKKYYLGQGIIFCNNDLSGLFCHILKIYLTGTEIASKWALI